MATEQIEFILNTIGNKKLLNLLFNLLMIVISLSTLISFTLFPTIVRFKAEQRQRLKPYSKHLKKLKKMSPNELVHYYHEIKRCELADNIELKTEIDYEILDRNERILKHYKWNMTNFVLFEMEKRTTRDKSLKNFFYQETGHVF